MKKSNSISWKLFLTIAVFIPIVAMAIYYYYDRMVADLPYYGEDSIMVDKEESTTIPEFAFVNQDSSQMNNGFVRGKVWVANYFFSVCPTICPPMMTNLKKVQDAYRGNKEFRMVSFTVDPKRDTPAILKKYANGRSIHTDQWQLLTGSKKLLYRLARKGFFIEATEGSGDDEDFIHSEKIVLIDRDGHIRGYYDGTESRDIDLLISQIGRLLETKN